jgi:hypothetical protein
MIASPRRKRLLNADLKAEAQALDAALASVYPFPPPSQLASPLEEE